LLVAFTAIRDSSAGISAAMFYSASYAAMNVGAFAVVSHFASAGEKPMILCMWRDFRTSAARIIDT